eukprot:c3951_g1_i1.p1 GENE.c3951_g1_i1~~c3951_g1_i1.p1  ORF type:complete len:637 (+),score=197.93 c3951_g1_i1:71-1912(+)
MWHFKSSQKKVRSTVDPKMMASDIEEIQAPDDTGTSSSSPTPPLDQNAAVRVFCRVRPEQTSDTLHELPSCVRLGPEPRTITSTRVDMMLEKRKDKRHPTQKQYHFHDVFPPHVSQKDVYTKVCDGIVPSLFCGINAAVIACGQTGAGKTHTMMGPPHATDTSGIIPRLLTDLFLHANTKYANLASISASFFEIYFERVFDLLAPWRQVLSGSVESCLLGSPGLQLLQGSSDDLLVRDGIRVPVTSAAQAMLVFEQGRQVRMSGATSSNHYSSRSHAIFVITTHVCDPDSGTEFMSQLYLCDLAGSERVSKAETEGVRLSEAGHINHSILTLGKVIASLADNSDLKSRDAEPKRHIPYRDSKLTRFLTNALGGNGLTSLLMCVSPDPLDACETDATLQLGARSQKIQNVIRVNACRSVEELERSLGQANEQIQKQDTVVKQQQQQITSLVTLLQQLRDMAGGAVPPSVLQAVDEAVVAHSPATPAGPFPSPAQFDGSLQDLPFDIRLLIISMLDGDSVLRMRHVSRTMHATAMHPSLYHALIATEFGASQVSQSSSSSQSHSSRDSFHHYLKLRSDHNRWVPGKSRLNSALAHLLWTPTQGVFLLKSRTRILT